MHALFFRLKRAYQAPLKAFNGRLRAYSLTCARYDLLHALRGRLGRLQSELWKTLGVTRPVVCRMVKALERMKLVRRRVAEDKRQRFVELTPRARALLDSGTLGYWVGEDVELAMTTAIGDRCVWDEGHKLKMFDRAEQLLDDVRETFGDFAFLDYDWCDDHTFEDERFEGDWREQPTAPRPSGAGAARARSVPGPRGPYRRA